MKILVGYFCGLFRLRLAEASTTEGKDRRQEQKRGAQAKGQVGTDVLATFRQLNLFFFRHLLAGLVLLKLRC